MNIISIFLRALESVLFDAISEAQREYRKDHILDPYDPDKWQDDIFWRN